MAILCSAISSRRLVGLVYDGRHRIVEPQCHGAGAEGQQFLRAYQVAGDSATGHLGWKLFDLSRIANVRIYDETFAPRPVYRAEDVAMHPCTVPYSRISVAPDTPGTRSPDDGRPPRRQA